MPSFQMVNGWGTEYQGSRPAALTVVCVLAGDLFHGVAFDDVAQLDIVELLNGQAALIALLDFLDGVLETLQRAQAALVNHDAVADNADGTVADATKHTYNQAFAIYALAEYYRAAGKEKALHLACGLFDVIEQKCRDEDGYLEAFTADWRPAGNEKLSENGVMAYRTMNTLLHLMEGYTGLYQASRDPKVKERLTEIVLLWEKRIYNRKLRRQEVFFDREYHSLIDLHSFGHDIETSWLMDHTLDVLEDEDLIRRIRPLLIEMAENTKEAAFGDHGFANECERGKVDEKRIWWVQAEALVGFLNLWKHTGEKRYLADAQSLWYYISNTIKDKRPGSEWYWFVDADGTPSDKPLVEPWKCPYHNGRMALEAMRRLKGVQII